MKNKAITGVSASACGIFAGQEISANHSSPEISEHKTAAGTRMIVTTLRGRQLTAEETNGRITDLFFEDPEADSIVGRIYVGTVKQIRTNIQAAFIELGGGLMAYYPLEDWERFPVEGVAFREGAQIPVMVTKDAQKTKAPTVTTALTFTGQYLVLTPSKQGVFFSSRLNDPERKQALRALLGEAEEYSLIVRTNAAQASDSAILAERDRLLLSGRQEPPEAFCGHRSPAICRKSSETGFPAFLRLSQTCRTCIMELRHGFRH